MTPLQAIIADIIASEGPMPLDRYMALCLGHPTLGYYMTRDPFGETGDFVTAPEISQIFGELLGVWCATAWAAMGKPAHFNLVELGPGRGTLMADVLKAGRAMPGFYEAARINLVEMSPVLRELQRARVNADVTWHDTLSGVDEGPFILLANEFFDAIPVRQFEKRDRKWFERCVGVHGMGYLPSDLEDTYGMNGDVVEFAPQRQAIAEDIGRRLAAYAGLALVIDYGHVKTAPGDTLQAVRGHEYVPVTDRPGESDITSHVDFEALAKALVRGGGVTYPPLTQRGFLLAMGLEPRAAMLAAKATPREAEMIERSVSRLVDEAEMGNLFKVMVGTSPGLATPYPFGRP